MTEPKTLYRVTIDHMAREYKVFNSEEEAVNFAKSMMEADGKHIFMSSKRGCDNKLVLRWVDLTETEPQIVSKIIGIANADELRAYAKWCHEQEKIKQMQKWENTRKTLLEQIEKAKKIKCNKTMAVCWID